MSPKFIAVDRHPCAPQNARTSASVASVSSPSIHGTGATPSAGELIVVDHHSMCTCTNCTVSLPPGQAAAPRAGTRSKQKGSSWDRFSTLPAAAVGCRSTFAQVSRHGWTLLHQHTAILWRWLIAPFDHVLDAAAAEAIVMRRGISLALSLGCSRVIVNSDCMDVIDSTMAGEQSLGPSVAVYDDYYRLAQDFTRIIFEHRPREANVAAHTISSYICT